jgi:hypothetical protein
VRPVEFDFIAYGDMQWLKIKRQLEHFGVDANTARQNLPTPIKKPNLKTSMHGQKSLPGISKNTLKNGLFLGYFSDL